MIKDGQRKIFICVKGWHTVEWFYQITVGSREVIGKLFKGLACIKYRDRVNLGSRIIIRELFV